MGRVIKWFFVIGLLAALGYGGWLWFRPVAGAEGKTAQGAPAAMAVPVRVAPATRQDVPRKIKVVGTVVPGQSVAVRARIDSQIVDVRFHDGDAVLKGDVLFVLDDRALKAQLVQVQANLQRDRAQLENLRRQYERTLKLSRQGYASSASRDDAKAALDVASATVGADKAALENINVQLGYTVITAPIDGRTGTINVTSGNTVKANDAQPLVTINQVRPILVQASLPQSDFDALRQAVARGDVPVSALRTDGTDAAQGTLQYIDNTIDQGTGTFATRAIFENTDEGLWPGMLVTLILRVGEDRQAVVVPEVAIQHGPTGDYVFAVDGGKLRKQDVVLARMEEGLALVAKGLSGSEQVVVDGFLNLKDGIAVTATPVAQARPQP